MSSGVYAAERNPVHTIAAASGGEHHAVFIVTASRQLDGKFIRILRFDITPRAEELPLRPPAFAPGATGTKEQKHRGRQRT